MKKFKIVLMFIAMFMMVGTLSSCASKPKEFSSNGITITLTNKFKYGNDENVQVLLLTSKIGFMGNGEYKTSVGVSDNQLEHYTQKVLNVSGKTADITNYDEDGVTFCYAYYTATAQNITFKYMLITKDILLKNREFLEKATAALIEKETLLHSDVKKIRESSVITDVAV